MGRIGRDIDATDARKSIRTGKAIISKFLDESKVSTFVYHLAWSKLLYSEDAWKLTIWQISDLTTPWRCGVIEGGLRKPGL